MVALGLLGLVPYAFLWTHVNYAPLGSWGNTGTLDGFITHFTRKEYGTFQVCVCVCVCVRALVCVRVCIFTHTYTHTLSFSL
jgi:hypothetical protein